MELKQLEMLVALVEERKVCRAAERVFRTPPAVTIALKKLQEEIRFELFDRSDRHNFLLTQAGAMLYGYATKLLALRDETIASLNELRDLRCGHLRLGATENISFHLVPTITEAFHQQCPDIKVEMITAHSNELLGQLKERKIELALLAFLPQDHEIETELIMRDELVLIVSPQHRFGVQARVRIADLGGEGFIVERGFSSLEEKIVAALQQAHPALKIMVESTTTETVKKMVARNMGIAFVPLICVREELARKELAVVAVEGFRTEQSLWAAWRRESAHSPAAQAFMHLILSLAESLLGKDRTLTLNSLEKLANLSSQFSVKS